MEGNLFLKGPIYRDWLLTAARLGKPALEVALSLAFRAGCKKADEVRLSVDDLEDFLATPTVSVRRGIVALEAAGLVRVVTSKKGRKRTFRLLNWRPPPPKPPRKKRGRREER